MNLSITQKELIQMIQFAASKGNVLITEHASERMWERNISRIMIDKCLLTGHIQPSKPIKFNDEMQTYECRMSNYYAGVDYDVVTAINPNDPTAIIVTVIDTKD